MAYQLRFGLSQSRSWTSFRTYLMGTIFGVPILLYQSQVVAKNPSIKDCLKDSVKLRPSMAYQLRFSLSHSQ